MAKISIPDYERSVLRKVPVSHVAKYDMRTLMWLYEINYSRASQLLAGWPADAVACSCADPDGGPTLYVRRLKTERYTETWHLSYFVDEEGERVADPDLSVRLYRDSHQAVTHECGRHDHLNMLSVFDTEEGDQFRRRWNMNMLLYKWLEWLCSKPVKWEQE